MAKRMKSKIQPAVMKFNFNVSVSSTDQKDYLDLSQVASLVNRRFYRQGLQWAVSSIKVQTKQSTVIGPAPGDPEIKIGKLPHSWVMSNSWEKGMRHWLKDINETLDETGSQSIKGKFLDFKIYANEGHFDAGFGSNLLPVDSAGNTANVGEWIPSAVTIPLTTTPGSATQYEICAVGPNYGSAGTSAVVSLINGYANSRALPNLIDPNAPSDVTDIAGATPENWLGAIDNEGTTQDIGVILEATIQDQPPYPYENDGNSTDTQYPGGRNQLPALEIHDRALISTTTIGNRTMLDGGMFPCGLMEINWINFNASTEAPLEVFLEIQMVPGTHRGYLAEPMTEM